MLFAINLIESILISEITTRSRAFTTRRCDWWLGDCKTFFIGHRDCKKRRSNQSAHLHCKSWGSVGGNLDGQDPCSPPRLAQLLLAWNLSWVNLVGNEKLGRPVSVTCHPTIDKSNWIFFLPSAPLYWARRMRQTFPESQVIYECWLWRLPVCARIMKNSMKRIEKRANVFIPIQMCQARLYYLTSLRIHA